ncbi:MAG: FtsX-like permease family protein [Cyclobacteriaceae bacterium]
MNVFLLVWSYLKSKPLNTVLNIVLFALGIAVITVLLLFNNQLEEKISSNAKGIDLVVGAKGSPLQLILCNIFHIDFPTGNINLKEAEQISRSRLIKKAVPLALGDSYQSYRIVGTTAEYADLYHLELAQGAWWNKELETTIGATVARELKLNIGSTFQSTHGLAEGGSGHEEQRFVVKGILKQTNSVVDNLILTSVETVWHVHEHAAVDSTEKHEVHTQPDSSFVASRLIPTHPAGDSTKEVTSLLIQYRSPMAAIQLPRMINGESKLQAASPAFETARLFSILGVGVEILTGFAYVLIFISALSVFIALYNSLKERRYDLAIMRSMGASKSKLFVNIVLEGVVLTALGSMAGLLLGHGILMALGTAVEEMRKAGLTGFVFYSAEWIILAGSLLLGMICALIPALQAYRTDISRVLASN